MTLDELREELSRSLGAWYAGTVTFATKNAVIDTALLGAGLEEDAWVGAWLAVDTGGGVQESRRITAYTVASYGFTVRPDLDVTPTAGAVYEVHLRQDAPALHWAINRAILDARPDVYTAMVSDLLLTGQLQYMMYADVDELIGLEVEAGFEDEGFVPVPTQLYTVQEKHAPQTYATYWEFPTGYGQETFGPEGGDVYVTFRQPLPAGRRLRVHFKQWYPTLTAGTMETWLDHDFLLWTAEAHLRRYMVGVLQGSAVEHHKEMMVHAEEMARARRAVIVANLAGVPLEQVQGKKKR